MSPNLDRHVVTAVLVAHDGARWLPDTLKALLTQARPVQRLVTVDNGSQDRGPAVLAEVVGAGNVLTLPRTTGYGEAVAEALRQAPATAPVPDDDPGNPRTEWVWLLHDDSAPAHDALALLLRMAGTDPDAAVLGPKIRDWDDRRMLRELGVAIDGAGRRETGLDRRELDQGQHDGVRDVLAVGSAGMLVRRDVWDRLGGFDVEFGLFRDDVDFCWRAHAAGHRVVVVSDAVVHHAEASRRGVREIGMSAEHPRRRDRRNALYTLLGNLPFPAMLRALARNLWATLLRALHLLVIKQPGAAREELGALGDVLRDPGRLRRVRAARASGRKRVYRSVRRFQPRRVALRRLLRGPVGVPRRARARSARGRRGTGLRRTRAGPAGAGPSRRRARAGAHRRHARCRALAGPHRRVARRRRAGPGVGRGERPVGAVPVGLASVRSRVRRGRPPVRRGARGAVDGAARQALAGRGGPAARQRPAGRPHRLPGVPRPGPRAAPHRAAREGERPHGSPSRSSGRGSRPSTR